MESVKRGSDANKALLSSQRRFQVWQYDVTHSQLLLRANPDDRSEERIEVLFKGVESIQLPTVLEGLTVIEDPVVLSSDSAAKRDSSPTKTAFRVEGANYRGVVVCAAAFVNIDRRSYSEPSGFANSELV